MTLLSFYRLYDIVWLNSDLWQASGLIWNWSAHDLVCETVHKKLSVFYLTSFSLNNMNQSYILWISCQTCPRLLLS